MLIIPATKSAPAKLRETLFSITALESLDTKSVIETIDKMKGVVNTLYKDFFLTKDYFYFLPDYTNTPNKNMVDAQRLAEGPQKLHDLDISIEDDITWPMKALGNGAAMYIFVPRHSPFS